MLWAASGDAHGQDEQHRHQAEREIAEAEARSAADEQFTAEKFTAETMDVAPAEPARKKAAQDASPRAVEAAPTFAGDVRAPKQASTAASPN